MNHQRLDFDSTRVAQEDVDGEIIAINFDTGAYFNMCGTGAEIWRLLLAGYCGNSIASAYARHADDSVSVHAQVTDFIAALIEPGLLVPVELAPIEQPPSVGTFSRPVLEKFEDMAEMIKLDPIHEVSDRGWPHSGPSK